MIPVVTLPIPDAEVSFLPSKSDLTLVQVRSSKNFISFAYPSAKPSVTGKVDIHTTLLDYVKLANNVYLSRPGQPIQHQHPATASAITSSS